MWVTLHALGVALAVGMGAANLSRQPAQAEGIADATAQSDQSSVPSNSGAVPSGAAESKRPVFRLEANDAV